MIISLINTYLNIKGVIISMNQSKNRRICICRRCKHTEFWDKMMWKHGMQICRSCYKSLYEQEHREPYQWNDLDGYVPTLEDYALQKELNLSQYNTTNQILNSLKESINHD